MNTIKQVLCLVFGKRIDISSIITRQIAQIYIPSTSHGARQTYTVIRVLHSIKQYGFQYYSTYRNTVSLTAIGPNEKQLGSAMYKWGKDMDRIQSNIVQFRIHNKMIRQTTHRQVLLLNFLCGFKSTTITVMLSLLPLWRASFERNSAAAWAAGSTPSPLSVEATTPFFLCQSRIRLRATSQTSSFVRTSHNPSLAKIRHSSSFTRGTNMTSGSGIIHGFKYLSPAPTKKI